MTTSRFRTRSAIALPRRTARTVWVTGAAWVGLAAAMVLASPAAFAKPAEQLVIFVSGSASSQVAESLRREQLPTLEEMAKQLDIDLEVVDVDSGGAPPEVHVTPLLVYQSPRGRAFFQGRYVDTGKVAHFVRTQRAVPPAGGTYVAKDAEILELGRARVLAPIKVTPLAGETPSGFDAEAFDRAARAAIADGLGRFVKKEKAELGPSDRAFYMDFYPFRSEDGQLFISSALFSQFNCIEPVFTSFKKPVSGSFEAMGTVFAEAAAQLQSELMQILAASPLGDGFDPVPATLAEASWQALGLELPAKPAGEESAASIDVELPRRWQLDPPSPNGAPRLVFRFPAPLDRYSGEVGELTASLELPQTPQLGQARGFIEVETSSVTMGEKSLDNAVHSKMILIDRFPKARFTLEQVASEDGLAFGRSSRMLANGTFTMMGVSIPLEVRAQLEPTIGEDGAPHLHVQAGFEIRLTSPFGVHGPDGPAPANDTLQFTLDVLMSAAADSPADSPAIGR